MDPALLAAILDRPDDDMPRLAMADWLDEHQQCERAEFIRLQCRIAQLESSSVTVGLYSQLRRREHELLNKPSSGADWGNWVPQIAGTIWEMPDSDDGGAVSIIAQDAAGNPILGTSSRFVIQFRRGFIHTIRCTGANWQRQTPPSLSLVPYQTFGQMILRQQPVEQVIFGPTQLKIACTPECKKPDGCWSLVHNLGLSHAMAFYQSRAALIEGIPAKLRGWLDPRQTAEPGRAMQ